MVRQLREFVFSDGKETEMRQLLVGGAGGRNVLENISSVRIKAGYLAKSSFLMDSNAFFDSCQVRQCTGMGVHPCVFSTQITKS